MSFNIQGPSNQPIIQSSQGLGKDGGGGGNTGFMNMRGGKKKKEKDEEDNSVFLEDDIEDKFTKTTKEEKPPKKTGKFLGAISKFIKKPKGNNNSLKNKVQGAFFHNDSFEKNTNLDNFQDLDYKNNQFEETYEIIDDTLVDDIKENFVEDIPEDGEDDGYYDDIDI